MAVVFRMSDTPEARAKKLKALESQNLTATQGVAVAAAAGANPTAAEYLALLTSLRDAGVIAT